MTCIVGIKTDNGVLLGGDSVGSNRYTKVQRKDEKVFFLDDKSEIAVGFTSSFRMGQIIRYHLRVPEIAGDEYVWAVREFIPALIKVLGEHGFMTEDKGVKTGGNFLLAVKSRLFNIESDFQVGESIHDYDACGCGEDFALGSLFSTEGNEDLSATDRASLALRAAEKFSNGVGEPFNFVLTKR